MTVTEEAIDRALQGMLELALSDDALRREHAEGRREFFRASARERAPEEERLAERRLTEWFLLERYSQHLAGVPVERLGEAWLAQAAEATPATRDALLSSQVGIFELTGVTPGQGVWVRDLTGFGEYPLSEARGSLALEVGDLLIGRIFPVGDAQYRISRASAHFRNAELLAALRDDLERLRASRRGVMRVAQSELERMFWAERPGAEQLADPVEHARQLMLVGGVEPEDVRDVLAELAAHPFDPERVVVGGNDPLGDVLDRLAFETSIDLEELRRALYLAWPRLAPPRADGAPSEPSGPRAVDVRAAVAAFDQGRSRGEDLEGLFRQLEQDLRLEGDDDETGVGDVPDFPGVVGAMVTEYLWELGREVGQPAAHEQSILHLFGRYAKDVGNFENLRPQHLLAFAAAWVPERADLENADEARRLVGALRGFCRWSEERHQLPLWRGFRETLKGIESSLPRVVEANRRLLRLEPRDSDEIWTLGDRVDGSRVSVLGTRERSAELELDPEVLRWLRPGDRVRLRHTAGAVELVRCYPPECAALGVPGDG